MIYKGVVVIFHKTNGAEPQFLVVENAKTGNVSFVSGAKEDIDTSLEATAEREIQEELGLIKDQYALTSTPISYEFVFGPQKPERTGAQAEYHVFLASLIDDNTVPYTQELTSAKWMTASETISALSFPDLRTVFEKIRELI